MPWIDGHLDLAYLVLEGRDLCRACPDSQSGCISLPELREARFDLVFATIFTEPGGMDAHGAASYAGIDDVEGASAAGHRQLEIYRTLERKGELSFVRTARDLAADGPRPQVVLLMEGADPIRSPEDVAAWHDHGLRIVGLTWAAGTRYAGGNHRLGPLTPLGVELLAALDEHGIVHDASHLSDEAFDGVLGEIRGPIVASHSNCRALVNEYQRHLRDDQVVEIGRRDGVIGLNLFSKFLVPSGRATIGDCVAHIERVADLMGHRRGVALGSDMDGGFGPESLPEGLDHPRKLEALTDALRDNGWSDGDLEGLRQANWRRFLERVLPR